MPSTADSFTGVENLATDTNAVYASLLVEDFGSDGSVAARIDVVRVPLDCGPPTLLVSKPGESNVWRSIISDDRLYVEMSDGIYSVPTAGGALTTEAATRPLILGNGSTFAVSGATLAWIDENGALWTVATGGAQSPQALANAPAAQAALGGVDVHGDGLRERVCGGSTRAGPAGDAGGSDAVADGGDGGNGGIGSIVAIPLAGGASTVLATGQHVPGEIMVSGGTLYWTNSFSIPTVDTASAHGPILSLTLPSGAPSTIVADDVAPEQLMLRGSALYWIDNGGPDGGDAIHTLMAGVVTDLPTPRVVGLDGLTLGPKGAYWARSGQELYGIAL